MKTVDARGLSCPEPVLITKKAVQQDLPVAILVDHQVAVDNITRFARKEGLNVVTQQLDSHFEIHLSKK